MTFELLLTGHGPYGCGTRLQCHNRQNPTACCHLRWRNAGIGECAVRTLAATHAKHDGKELRVYVVGRNKDVGEKITSDCLEVCAKGHFRFVQANDLSLLEDGDCVCAKIKRLEETAGAKAGVGFH
jgi:hypothetical protein